MTDFMSEKKPIQNPAVLSRSTLNDSIVLVNGDTGAFLALNSSGKVIWNLINGKRTETELIGHISRHFQSVPERVTDDVSSLLSTLSEEGFIGYEISADFLKK